MSTATDPLPFSLRKRFALASLLVIGAIALSLGWLLANILTERMIQREGQVTQEFVQNLLITDQSAGYLLTPNDPELRARFLRSMEHISSKSMREPVRANAYSLDGTIIWSTNKKLVGVRHADNDERDEAIKGKLVVESGRTLEPGKNTPDHEGLGPAGTLFVETYIPVRDPVTDKMLGVMELYKLPPALDAAIRAGVLQLWLACALCAVGLFVTLYWIVARADRLLRAQQVRLAEAQTLASAVELASAVAHNIRNPLASIRVSAEMLEHSQPAGQTEGTETTEHCRDIMHSVDRADRWITELVRVAQAPQLQPEPVSLGPLVKTCLAEMEPELLRRHIIWTVGNEAPADVMAHTAILRQILVSIMANAIEAMPGGGELHITWRGNGPLIGVRLTDSGTGISEDVRQRLFRPFFSTKSGGLGIGLALVKRMVEQWSGTLTLTPAQPRGTTVEILLPRAVPAAPALRASRPAPLA